MLLYDTGKMATIQRVYTNNAKGLTASAYIPAMSDPSHYCYNLDKEQNVCISETAVAQTEQQYSTPWE